MNDEEQRLSSIAIFGRPHELWPTVAILGCSLPDYIDLKIVEDDSSGAEPAALSLARDNSFHDMLGIDTRQLLLECGGILGLGTELQGLPGDQGSHFVAPSGKLPLIAGATLQDIMLRAARLHSDPSQLSYLLQPFRFAARAAQAGKFAEPESAPLSPTRMLGPTLQIDRAKYAEFLKKNFLPRSSNLKSGRAVSVQEKGSGGEIETVKLNNGETVAADLFIDLSGAFSGFVKDKSQRTPGLLPFDRMIGCFDEARPSAVQDHRNCRIRAMSGGILLETPLREGLVSELLFSSADMDETALADLVIDNAVATSFDTFTTGKPWIGNLLRMGSASACLGPYQSADMRLLHEHAKLFAAHIPTCKDMAVEAAEFNHHQIRSLEEIRDFTLLPFLSNRRQDRLWKDLADAPPPESLQLRIDQFESRGNFIEYDHEIFDTQSWTELMIGMGYTPRRFDPSARAIDMQRVQPALKSMASDFNKTLASMPDHAEFMESYLAEKT